LIYELCKLSKALKNVEIGGRDKEKKALLVSIKNY